MILVKDAIVARMKVEVLMDIMRGRVPSEVDNFGDLHSHVDANYYGGFLEDEVFDAMLEQFGDPDWVDFVNECQDEISAWLANGRK